MPAGPSNEDAPQYLRDFRFGVDGQWRVTIPAPWREQTKSKLYLRVKADHLQVLPQAELDTLRAWADALPGKDRTSASRAIALTIEEATIDKGNRITLHREWAERVGIQKDKEVMLVGAMGFFEIWSPVRFEKDETGVVARGLSLLEGRD